MMFPRHADMGALPKQYGVSGFFRGGEALAYFAERTIGPVLDIGSGEGFHARYLRECGIETVTLDDKADADLKGNFLGLFLPDVYHGIHCCHVLEHQRNPGLFLDKIFDRLADDGWLCITVPPAKHEIVGGHVTLWNAGILVYNLILAGFDCSQAWVRSYGYNVSVVVKKKPADLSGIRMANGDIERLAPYFPWENVRQGFYGK